MPKKEPFELPDDQCERVTKPEMVLINRILALSSDVNYAKDDLKKRLQCVPYGVERMNMIVGNINSLFLDIMGTVNDKQRRQIKNTANDYYMELRPRMASNGNRVWVSVDEIKELVNLAKEKCRSCAEDDNGARKCRLYQWLEANIPLEDYGDGLICPYATIDWKE